MIFINAMLGTLAGVRRMGGSELVYKKATVIRLKVIVDLSKGNETDSPGGKYIYIYILKKNKNKKALTSSTSGRPATSPLRTQVGGYQKSRP